MQKYLFFSNEEVETIGAASLCQGESLLQRQKWKHLLEDQNMLPKNKRKKEFAETENLNPQPPASLWWSTTMTSNQI